MDKWEEQYKHRKHLKAKLFYSECAGMAQRLLQTAATRFFPGSSPGTCLKIKETFGFLLMNQKVGIFKEIGGFNDKNAVVLQKLLYKKSDKNTKISIRYLKRIS